MASPNRLYTNSYKCSMNVVENKYHLILVSLFFSDWRKLWLPKYFNPWPNIVKIKETAKHRERQTFKKPA